MPSGGPFWQNSLARRVRHLERKIQPNRQEHWRAYLSQVFAAAQYDAQREAILDALCSETPWFNFTTEHDGERFMHMTGWPLRDKGGPPYDRLIIITLDADLGEAI